VQQFAFGMLWSRDALAVKQRSLVTVSQLAALGKLEELRGHLRGALNVGWTKEELVEVVVQAAVYAASAARSTPSAPPPRCSLSRTDLGTVAERRVAVSE
jgi:alkylhydroperoxidase/carboxymuconolactone decarboxylase family protein YurZ